MLQTSATPLLQSGARCDVLTPFQDRTQDARRTVGTLAAECARRGRYRPGVVMGSLTCEQRTVELEDRLLTHLQIVIVNRFRRGDAFLLSWIDAVEVGSGRSSVWLTPSTPVHFRFTAARVPPIDRAWIMSLDAAAASATGLIVADEEGHPVRVGAAAAAPRPQPVVRSAGSRQPVPARAGHAAAGLRR